ncbi:MAG: glycosyltransferase [Gallionellaceae bacterium]|nr:glycosyltransferase [Gallionellaceae bacterium]
MPTVLWWARPGNPYSRNRVLRQLLTELGWTIIDFQPRLSMTGDWQARIQRVPNVDLVWVPCFRQRDLTAALRWSRARGIPLLADPLISAYDKQVFERAKYPPGSFRARRLQAWEGRLLAAADAVLADTAGHARFFHAELGVETARLHVVPVGAEEALFRPAATPMSPHSPLEVLFYGSFIQLQGPLTIIEAARLYSGPPVVWRLVGDGPLRAACMEAAAGLASVVFEDWIDYEALPSRIHRADLVLGIFGTTAKAARVIPNKVYQAMACGRPLVTRAAPAYTGELLDDPGSGIQWVDGGDAADLAAAVARLARSPETLPERARQTRLAYERHFSLAHIRSALAAALAEVAQ